MFILSKIMCQSEDCMDKNLSLYKEEDRSLAVKDFRKEVRDLLVDLAMYDLDLYSIAETLTNERIIELLEEDCHNIIYSIDSYFSYVKCDGTQEIEIDLEKYNPIGG